MKRAISICLSLSLLSFFFVSCSDWTDTEAEYFPRGGGQSDEYYENLRKWKAETKYDMAWGWFGGWGANTPNMRNSLAGLPDSLYMAAIWGQWRPSTVTAAKRADMEYVQKVKGTKVVATSISGWVGKDVIGGHYTDNPDKEAVFGWSKDWEYAPEYNAATTGRYGWRFPDNTTTRELQEASIRRYARALADSVFLAGFDGLDIDYEPGSGGPECHRELSHVDNFFIFTDELGKYMGPKSGTGKLLVLDGEIRNLEARCMPYFDYLIYQAYGSTGGGINGNFGTWAGRASEYMTVEEFGLKFYTTENFESSHASGGQLMSQATWQPTYNGETVRKGGWGSYHIEYEYTVSGKAGFYPWTRAALNAVHPPKTGEDETGEEGNGEGETGK